MTPCIPPYRFREAALPEVTSSNAPAGLSEAIAAAVALTILSRNGPTGSALTHVRAAAGSIEAHEEATVVAACSRICLLLIVLTYSIAEAGSVSAHFDNME